jgi:hypothetical protein
VCRIERRNQASRQGADRYETVHVGSFSVAEDDAL